MYWRGSRVQGLHARSSRRRWLRLQPDLHTVCRSFHKISSALSAKVRGGSRSAKILIQSRGVVPYHARTVSSGPCLPLGPISPGLPVPRVAPSNPKASYVCRLQVFILSQSFVFTFTQCHRTQASHHVGARAHVRLGPSRIRQGALSGSTLIPVSRFQPLREHCPSQKAKKQNVFRGN